MNARTRVGGPAPLIIVVLVILAGLVVWSAIRMAASPTTVGAPGGSETDGSETGSESGTETRDPSPSPTIGPSGWAPPTFAKLDSGQVVIDAVEETGLARATLASWVDEAPVVVTVDTTQGPGWDEATALASDLRAPLLVVGDPAAVGQRDDASGDATNDPSETATDGAGQDPGATEAASIDATEPAEDATETATDDATGTASDDATDATGESTDETAAGSVPTPEELLAAWNTQHVVAIGTPPDVTATIHQVEVIAPTSTGEDEASDDGTAADDGTASDDATDGLSEEPTAASATPQVTYPESLDAMLADAVATGDEVAAPEDVVVVVRPDDATPELLANLATFDMTTVEWTKDDPRRDDALREALAGVDTTVLAVSDAGLPDMVGAHWPSLVTAAASAPELPGGGLVLFPEKTFIAIYGTPGTDALGVLGERDVQGSIDFVTDLASEYEGLFGDSQVQPAFEIITTVAAAEATDDGDYSRFVDLEVVEEWIDAAEEAGIYVVLDLQPGRSDFLSQARQLEHLLVRPNVGLALDPEWRLAPDQVHLRQIGTVTTAEVNAVSDYLAELVREHNLPQKLLVVHNFRRSMLTQRENLSLPPELATMIHIDGQGAQDDKDATYANITSAGPDGVWFGWKNFYDEDVGLRSPQDTAAVIPTPHLITYQ